MRTNTGMFTILCCFTCLFFVPVSIAGSELLLVGGGRAVIEGKQLVLIDRDSKRWIAPAGRYDTRDGKYSIIVKGNEIVVQDHTKVLR